MKLWSRLCFLVLAISSLSRGENGAAVTPGHDDEAKQDHPAVTTPAPLSPDRTHNEAARTTRSSPPPQNPTSATALPSTSFTTRGAETQRADDFHTTEEVNDSTATTALVSTTESGMDGVNVDVTTVLMATTNTSSIPVITEGTGGSSLGYVMLVLIVLVIIVLCVILYFLRRVSRTYSFDLHRQVPANHLDEPIGTFEPVYLDDLDRPAPKDHVITDDLSPPPVSNGTTLQSEERGSNGETAQQEQPDGNGLESSPTSNTSRSLGDNLADKTPSELSGTNLFFDAIGEEQQNENNNNNPSVCSSDPFVEINLDEPVWCDQLFTSPEAPSSVLPFSPFSFSSSTSS